MDPNVEVLNPASALASVGGDVDFLSEIAGLVRAAWPSLLRDNRQALAAGNLEAVESVARLAKAAAGYVSAGLTYQAAAQLQTMAVQRDLEGAKQVTANLEGEVAKLQPALTNLNDILRRPLTVV